MGSGGSIQLDSGSVYVLLTELLRTERTLVGHHPPVKHQGHPQPHPAVEDLQTAPALPTVQSVMLHEFLLMEVTFATFGTLERIFTSVFPVVGL